MTASKEAVSETPRPIIVGYPLRSDFLCVGYPEVPEGYEEHFARHAPEDYTASHIRIDNGTNHPVVLGALSRDNRVRSGGSIRDYGTNNTPLP